MTFMCHKFYCLLCGACNGQECTSINKTRTTIIQNNNIIIIIIINNNNNTNNNNEEVLIT